MSSSKTKWVTLIVVVFIIGGALGFVGGQSYQRYLFHKYRFNGSPPPPPGPRNPRDFQKRLLDELKKELGLSDDQTKKVADIFNQIDKKNQADREKRQADREQRMKSMREEVDKQIESVLNPEQKVKFAEFQKKLEQERTTNRERRWGQDTTSTSRDTSSKKEK